MRQNIVISAITFILLLVSGFFLSCSAPTSKVDQVANSKDKRILPLNDKFEIDALNGLSEIYLDTSQQLSYELATRALKLSKHINYKKGEAQAYSILGIYYFRVNNFLESFENISASLKISVPNNYESIINEGNYSMGVLFASLERRDRELEYVNKSMVYDKKKNIKEHLAGNYIRLGELSFQQGDTNGALILYFNALALKPKPPNFLPKKWVTKYIGNLYLSRKQYDMALFYYREVLKENPRDIGQNNGTIYSLIAYTYEQKKELKSSLYYHKIALHTRKIENQPYLVASSLVNIGYTFLKMGNYDSSLYYLESGLKIADLFKITSVKESGYKNLYELYISKKDWKKALFALQKYNDAKVLAENENNKDQISLLENNRIVSEKEKEAGRLRDENAIQKLEMKYRDLLMFLLMTLFLLTIAIAVYIQQMLVKNKKAKKVIEEKNFLLQDEIKEQVIQNEELTKREEEYRFLADHTADLVTLMDSNFKCLYISPSSEVLLGFSPEEMMGIKDYRDLIHPDSRKSFNVEVESMLEYHEVTRFLYQILKKDGTLLWVESNINPIIKPSTGKLQAILSVTRDVSNQIEEEQALMETARQKDLLIREVHHRVKNNLAILTSLVNMQKSEFTDHKTLDVFSDLQFRVKAMALVHEELYKSRNIEVVPVGEYLSKLVGIVSSAFTTSNVKVHQDFYDEIMDVKITLPLGLIVNELLTNAFKYAFPDDREGNIWVTYKKEPGTKKSNCEMRRLVVRDDGKGLPIDFDIYQKTSMGSQIICLLVQQLEAELIIDGTDGASFSLLLPAER
jgi:PAS domain S-box-containing protein